MTAYIISIIVFICIIVFQWVMFNSKAKQVKENIKQEIQVENNPFQHKIGIVKNKVNGNVYLGLINLDNTEQSILVYCGDELNEGDKFIIAGINGSSIIATKYNE